MNRRMNPSAIAQDELGPSFADRSDRFVAKGLIYLALFCAGYIVCELSHEQHAKGQRAEARK
jgi:hypothetical protein